jgi:hypothetical protein
MNLFIAWSGKTSHQVASALYGWLPCVIQAIKPFMSTEDIEKGSRWHDELAKELGEAAYGVICVTQDNYKKPWINFEAGAISKAVDKPHASPFLFNVKPSELDGPLQQFQSTVYRCGSNYEDVAHNNREDFFKLVHGINTCLKSERQVPYEILRKEFDLWWPELTKILENIPHDIKTHTGYDWLYTTGDLANEIARINEDMKCRCMWLITPDIYRNILNDDVKKAMLKHKDISYQFLVPKDINFNANKQALYETFFEPMNYEGEIPVESLPENKFSSLAVTDYIIMHPSSRPVQVFLELPLVADKVYWMKVTDKAARGFEVRFREYFKEWPPARDEDSPDPAA